MSYGAVKKLVLRGRQKAYSLMQEDRAKKQKKNK